MKWLLILLCLALALAGCTGGEHMSLSEHILTVDLLSNYDGAWLENVAAGGLARAYMEAHPDEYGGNDPDMAGEGYLGIYPEKAGTMRGRWMYDEFESGLLNNLFNNIASGFCPNGQYYLLTKLGTSSKPMALKKWAWSNGIGTASYTLNPVPCGLTFTTSGSGQFPCVAWIDNDTFCVMHYATNGVTAGIYLQKFHDGALVWTQLVRAYDDGATIWDYIHGCEKWGTGCIVLYSRFTLQVNPRLVREVHAAIYDEDGNLTADESFEETRVLGSDTSVDILDVMVSGGSLRVVYRTDVDGVSYLRWRTFNGTVWSDAVSYSDVPAGTHLGYEGTFAGNDIYSMILDDTTDLGQMVIISDPWGTPTVTYDTTAHPYDRFQITPSRNGFFYDYVLAEDWSEIGIAYYGADPVVHSFPWPLHFQLCHKKV